MKQSQRKIRYLPRFMLAALLFAQGILAAHACVEPLAGAAQALSARQSAETMHCHAVLKVNANECLMHCTQSDQVTLDQHAMPALAATDVVLHAVPPPVQRTVQISAYTLPVLNTGPPLSIRYCTFQI